MGWFSRSETLQDRIDEGREWARDYLDDVNKYLGQIGHPPEPLERFAPEFDVKDFWDRVLDKK